MTKIKDTPVNFRVYYKSMKDDYTRLLKVAEVNKAKLSKLVEELRNGIDNRIDVFKKEFNINLNDYEEYRENIYKDGTFFRVAKGLFINRKNNYTIVGDLYNLYTYAHKQKEIYQLDKDITLYNKCISLSLKEYTELLREFYTIVHKHMILQGEGYVFSDNIGWTCINRCKVTTKKSFIDYSATKKRKEELLAKGERLYNKEEAEWCKRNNINYDGVDFRVYLDNEYCYEIPLLGCKLPNGSKYKLEIADYRHTSVRGKTNEELAKSVNYNLEKVCELPIGIKTKLTICNNIDETLYTNFIRNENQTPINATKISRKDR